MDTQGTSSKRVGWTDMLVGAAALLENTERWDQFACFSVILRICIWHLAGLHNWRLVLIRKFYPRNAYFVFFLRHPQQKSCKSRFLVQNRCSYFSLSANALFANFVFLSPHSLKPKKSLKVEEEKNPHWPLTSHHNFCNPGKWYIAF